jgi:glycosyltransferase involved in cell wall biosynthesis
MHVAIDLRILDKPGAELSGIGRYALELARELPSARPEWKFTMHSNRPDLIGQGLRWTRWPTASSLGRVSWLQGWAALTRERPAPDLWFSPALVLPVWWHGPSVVTIHDLTFALMPERYRGRLNAAYARRATAWSARHADRVLCGSRETQARLVEHLGVDEAKVEVIPYGVSEAFLADGDTSPEPDDPFLLFVGVFEARKGLDTLHKALRTVNAAQRRVRLVLAGQPGWGTEAVVDALRRDPNVELVLRPTDAELARLYRSALALVYPSRMEGFGLPVAEAMAAGGPVIASDLDCIHEFAGDAVLYARPGDAAALARQIERLIDEPEERRAMTERGRDAAAPLRWPKVAQMTAETIESVVAGL